MYLVFPAKPYVPNLWYFELRLGDLTEFIVWNIKGLRHRVQRYRGKKIRVCDKNSVSMKYQRITSTGSKWIVVKNEFEASVKLLFLWYDVKGWMCTYFGFSYFSAAAGLQLK